MSKFTKEKDMMLINFVRTHSTAQYDSKEKRYKSNLLGTPHLWKNISKSLHIPVSDIKKRWQELKDNYFKMLSANMAKARGKNGWEYMSLLKFLSQNMNHEEAINLEPDETEKTGMIKNELEDTSNSSQNVKTEVLSDNNTDTSDSTTEGVSRGRKRKSGNVGSASTKFPKKSQDNKPAPSPNMSDHEITTATRKFFESMADIVSQFPPRFAAEARVKVCQVVTDIELKMHSDQGHSEPLISGARSAHLHSTSDSIILAE